MDKIGVRGIIFTLIVSFMFYSLLRIQLIKLNFLPILVNGYFLIPLIGRKSLVICGYLILDDF